MAPPPDVDFIALQEALAGEYSLDRELGRGGMGVVYLAREVNLARPVAIKVLPPALAGRPDLRDAFLREAQTSAALTHPNIVPVYAIGERAGVVYIVMAFVEGTTLGERIRTRGPLLPGQAARVLREVAWGLAYAHGAGLVHRDVTAENILLERGSERALITDFGIASAMRTNALSADGRVMGNAHYVSPEQAAGEPLDARSDLYSLGISGYYALTGRLPFDGESSAEVVRKQLTERAPSITSVASSVPPRLAAAVERCLHKEPLRRYRNAESFAEAIDLAFEHAKDIPAPLRSWIGQGEQELPARFALVGVGTMAGLTMVISGAAFGWFLLPFGAMAALSYVPWTLRLRRVLREGFVPDDLSAALREHQLVRAEELEYERRLASPVVRRVLRVTFAASVGSTLMFGALSRLMLSFAIHNWKVLQNMTQLRFGYEDFTYPFDIGFLVSLGVLTVASVGLTGDFVRFRLAARAAATSIRLWKSRWGRRLAALAGVGLTGAERPVLGMPLLTEVALGRATDHLYEALPKAARRELAALPPTVRRLEADAGRLRDSIASLDDQLAMFERGGDAPQHDGRGELADDLRETRANAAARLAETVGALESIRLDLLRLQLGSVGLESVTTSLESARRIGEQISATLAAQAIVEGLLGGPAERTLSAPPAPGADPTQSPDVDTPVSGVSAAHG
jgi:predicted Ser/Thr protein kinase